MAIDVDKLIEDTKKKQAEAKKNAATARAEAEKDKASAKAAAESKAQLLQMEAQSKIQLKEAEANYEIMKMQAEAELKKELMNIEFQYNMQLKGMDAEQLKVREDEKEKAKDKRIDIQASRQSELINQRKNNLPPIDFESTEDSLDGFDLESFEPR